MWQGDYPFLGYQVYSLGNQETGRYESGGNTILPNLIGGCEDGFEIDPQTQTCVATKFTPPSSKENTQGMTLGCTDSNSSNFNPEATTDDGSCNGSKSSMSSNARNKVLSDPYIQGVIVLGVVGLIVNLSMLKQYLPSK
ncbi:MAG: hypothetical protein CML44_04090 [Rhodobacteraceae bacterium]|nr:hypothetical protein [Paracoccaceae bacterium]|tara:strand:- start:7439 stop:7855 length:417 start_codon:yes stop_codon:yes gene_type:complete